jgi:K+-sensing histidine kinase KdpD
MTDKTALYFSIGSLVVSIGSLIASVVSARIASGAKQQARQAATLTPRTEAIDHLHKAVSYVQKDQDVTPAAIQSIRNARNRADPVFNEQVRSDLERAVQTAERLLEQQVQEGGGVRILTREPWRQQVYDFVGDLQNSSSG